MTIPCSVAIVVAIGFVSAASARAQEQAPPSPTALSPATPPSQEQAAEPAWQPRSGDAWIDRQLTDINVYGARYRGAFIDEVVRYHAAPRELITGLVTQRNWAPGDVYYACTVAQIVGKPCRQVVELWSHGQADGWQAVSKAAGMTAPDAWSRARSDIRESYVRWGRPLAVEPKTAPKPKAARASPRKHGGKARLKR